MPVSVCLLCELAPKGAPLAIGNKRVEQCPGRPNCCCLFNQFVSTSSKSKHCPVTVCLVITSDWTRVVCLSVPLFNSFNIFAPFCTAHLAQQSSHGREKFRACHVSMSLSGGQFTKLRRTTVCVPYWPAPLLALPPAQCLSTRVLPFALRLPTY